MSPGAYLLVKLSDLRHMLSLVNGMPFTIKYNKTLDKSRIDAAIKSIDRAAFDDWMTEHRELGEMPIRALRIIASTKHIPGYSRMDKATLIQEINRAK
jgi:hypothetical protein